MNIIIEIIIVSLCVVGVLAIIAIATAVFAFIWKYFLRKKVDVKERYGADGWVVITGASEGIGESFAQEFHKAGLNVLLVSRSIDKLNKAKNSLQDPSNNGSSTGALVDVFAYDFTQAESEEKLQPLIQKINSLEGGVSVLVNNVAQAAITPLDELTTQKIKDTIVCNVTGPTLLTRLLLPVMSQRINNNNKHALIINLSSMYGEVPQGILTTYCATKAFNNQFSRSLAEEYWGKLDVLSLKPAWTKTPMTQMLDSNHWYFIEAAQCVQATFKQFGKTDETYGHWKHGVYCWYRFFLPKCCTRKKEVQDYRDFIANIKSQIKEAEAEVKKSQNTA
jgi:17beta-estradiol 17-dehydrogenase / very-long-chain 3-oxoacyl-CoA reductase